MPPLIVSFWSQQRCMKQFSVDVILRSFYFIYSALKYSHTRSATYVNTEFPNKEMYNFKVDRIVSDNIVRHSIESTSVDTC